MSLYCILSIQFSIQCNLYSCFILQHELALCQARLFEKETEHAALRDKLSRYEDRILSNESKDIIKNVFISLKYEILTLLLIHFYI